MDAEASKGEGPVNEGNTARYALGNELGSRQLRITRGLFETLGEFIFKFYSVPGRHACSKSFPLPAERRHRQIAVARAIRA